MKNLNQFIIILLCAICPILLNAQFIIWGRQFNNIGIDSSQLLLSEGFNEPIFPPTGWQSIIIAGSYNWERKTANINPTCIPFEGNGMASFPSYSAPDGSMARLISPAINLGSTTMACTLKFAMYHDPDYSFDPGPDSVKIEYSLDSNNFNRMAAFRRYQPYEGWSEHSVYLGTFSGIIYLGLLAYSDYGNNINIDYVRLFGSLVINDVGVETIISPSISHQVNTPMMPMAIIKNYGNTSQSNFQVICSVIGSGTEKGNQNSSLGNLTVRYVDTLRIATLAAGDTARVSFRSWIPTNVEICSVKIRTNLAVDQNPVNDEKTQNTVIFSLISLISPNGGEMWAGGSYQQVKWYRLAPIFARHLLLFSVNSGITFTDTITDNVNPNDTTYNWLVPILNLNTCRVMLKVLDGSGTVLTVDTSDTDFTIDSEIPTSPTLISPINGIWLTYTNIIFNWSQVTFTSRMTDLVSPVKYILQVDTSSNFTNPVNDTTSNVYDTLTLAQARYYWRVRAYDLAGNQGAFTTADSFGIDNTAPSIPYLISPINNAILNDSLVQFYWYRSIDNVSGIRNYQIQIANNSSFTNAFDTTFADTTILRNLDDTTYFWRVKAIDRTNNQSEWSTTRNFAIQMTGIEEEQFDTLPSITALYLAKPNPIINRITYISFSLSEPYQVTLKIYNSSGSLIKTLADEFKNSGNYCIRWNCCDESNRSVAKGIYFYTLETSKQKFTKKIILTK